MSSSERSFPELHRTARAFCITSASWFVIGTLFGLGLATELVAPDFFGSVGWLTFGRIRAIHVNLVLFGLILMYTRILSILILLKV